jgi:hypothetical protein
LYWSNGTAAQSWSSISNPRAGEQHFSILVEPEPPSPSALRAFIDVMADNLD